MSTLNKPLLGAILMTLALSACDKSAQPDATAAKPAAVEENSAEEKNAAAENSSAQPIGDSSRTSLDWSGSYEGTVPCASCEGIKTRLVLNGDGSYQLETQYLGEQEAGAEPKVFEERGQFSWNDTGSAIQLESGAWYQVGENQLFMLDRDGKRITGALADNYRLAKSN
ncbi:copper resistance protein NlpE N-terminal domain-containing protein [Shewanella sp. JM162201]|uniref:Copper resistance protein NlpE N-terminal domain-containing protein n=1 Tax=Shewanella jiangmenensis TaxID=2837387 RepID=A0ABS5UY46_9GAMM|nr:copper resistance protein NlpE [Shewanella jiangmenensis]MBT1442992.1 copper resistance protein NlpE N-terminal domain-containing protein [Shewanella jiangmenensis]